MGHLIRQERVRPSGCTTDWLGSTARFLVQERIESKTPSMAWLHASLDFGLGFDSTRLGSQADKRSNWVDPVVEVLAFFSLELLPVRGIGIDERKRRSSSAGCLQRGWKQTNQPGTGPQFRWPSWTQPLDAWGIDALLDSWIPEKPRSWECLGVHSGWQTVSFQSHGSSDPTKAFASEAL